MNEELLAELNVRVDAGEKGLALASGFTARIDSILRDVFCRETEAVGRRNGGGKKSICFPGVALLATGGYGRSEMAPFSDIDILFLASERAKAGPAEAVLYKLWDLGLDISHAFRTPEECIEEAFRDIRTRTSLIEARFIAGDPGLFELFQRKVMPEILSKKQREFVREKLQEKGKRHMNAGSSVFLLEPNIKDGEGGLRDIHTAFWLSKVALRSSDYAHFGEVVAPEQRRGFFSALNFLLRTRFCLHLESGRKNDLLSFDFQRQVARRLGFRDSGKFSGVERFLRYYYLKSRAVVEVTSEIASRCSRMYVEVNRDLSISRINPNFSVSGGRLIASGKELLRDPDFIMEAFYHMSKTGKRFSFALRGAIRGNLQRMRRRSMSSPLPVHYFLEILKGRRVYETLREMHDSGVLGRFLPEFGALRMLVVHEPYHMYTVDEHTLIAIRNLENLKTTSYRSLEDLHHIINSVERLDVLFLALLLHDIGKAVGRHHEEEGYKRLKDILERFKLDRDKSMRIGFLVRNHILMSEIALKREVHDPEVIARFADAVEDPANLDALYLITYADMSAVNPGFWNSWKAYQLKELYLQTLEYLNGIEKDRSQYINDLLRLCNSADAAQVGSFIEDMPDRYLLSTPKGKILDDFRLLAQARQSGFALRIDRRSDGLVEVSVSASDSQGLFSKIVGLLSSKGLNIVNGRIFTGRNGFVIDKISVSNWGDVWWDGLVPDITDGLRAVVLEGGGFSVMRSNAATPSPYDIFIELDNEASEEYSLVEIFSPDRLGLLYEISTVFASLGMDITSARINTESGLAQDVFAVRAGSGKIGFREAERLLSALWKTLTEE